MMNALRTFYHGKRVLLTGHTGFKGGWLAHWLVRLGADKVIGLALPPDQGPDNLYDRSGLEELCHSHFQDIRDYEGVKALFERSQPEIVFHLAAQPLVIAGYENPLETYETNVMGTVNVLEAARKTRSVRSLVCVTTDKVYENKKADAPYQEEDRLGDKDPYAASKAAAEMVAKSYMSAAMRPEDRFYALATARGGNVIGGGDWSANRIIPDIVRSIAADTPLILRNPGAIRPWQHALELCYGYLLLGYRLYEGFTDKGIAPDDFIGAWNFGPDESDEITVSELVDIMLEGWGRPDFKVVRETPKFVEAAVLRLNSKKASDRLSWQPTLDAREAMAFTAAWYKTFLADKTSARQKTLNQIEAFEARLDARFQKDKSAP